MIRIIKLLIVVNFLIIYPVYSQESFFKETLLPEKNNVIGLVFGYTNIIFNSAFILDTKLKDPMFLPDSVINDRYTSESSGNWRLGLSYTYYFDKIKKYGIITSLSYVTRNANSTAQPQYLIRSPISKDTTTLFTEALIASKFSSINLDINGIAYRFTNIHPALGIYFGGGFSVNYLISAYSEFSETIKKTADGNSIEDVKFSNNQHKIVIDPEKDQFLQDALEASKIQFALQLFLGAEYFFNKDWGIRFELIEKGEINGKYFEHSQSQGILFNSITNITFLYAF